MMEKKIDIVVRDEGSIFLVSAETEEGRDWIEENMGVGEEHTYFGGSLVVEHRYIDDIIEGMLKEGLIVTLNGCEVSLRGRNA
jgi:hypothetical protein